MIRLRPYQISGIQRAREAAKNHRAIVMAAPTGSGKTVMFSEMAREAVASGRRVAIFTNRRLLTSQSSGVLAAHGVGHGIMAAGHLPQWSREVQVCSTQTVGSRVFVRGKWELPPADEVHIDEAHGQTADTASRIIEHYRQAGATIYGWSATPVYLGGLYEKIINVATKAELRAVGALVPCRVFSPNEPDMKGVAKNAVGEYVENGMTKRVMATIVHARVFDWWKTINTEQRPTILFAPGVAESRWFSEEFQKLGVTADHIDGETSEEDRQMIMASSRGGDTTVVCSCGVLREGVDMPWIEHGILVQVCGAYSTYLQIVGRLLRPWRDERTGYTKTWATLQDHAGAWWRHGSPNEDVEWTLEGTNQSIAAERKARLQDGQATEGFCCPECGGVRKQGPACPFCGHECAKSVRRVIQKNGRLKEMKGPAIKPKTQETKDDRLWKSTLFAAGRSGRTLRQAVGMFEKSTGRRVPPNVWPALPMNDSVDWNRRVRELYPWTARVPARRAKA